jgi:hypothetical protein
VVHHGAKRNDHRKIQLLDYEHGSIIAWIELLIDQSNGKTFKRHSFTPHTRKTLPGASLLVCCVNL